MKFEKGYKLKNSNCNRTNMEKASEKRRFMTAKHKLLMSSEDTKEVFSVRFDPEDKYLACGLGDGTIDIFNVGSGKIY